MLAPYLHKKLLEAGLDEAGRGCYAGPVFAAAVILPVKFKNKQLNDSKKLSERIRYELRDVIEREAIAFSVAEVSAEEIDEINILQASFLAMHRSIDGLSRKPESLLIDGNRFRKYKNIPHHCIIKGDGIYLSIAAASVLAKTYRDDRMRALHEKFPHFKWNENKGYGTASHRKAIEESGICIHHRKTFRLLNKQLKLW